MLSKKGIISILNMIRSSEFILLWALILIGCLVWEAEGQMWHNTNQVTVAWSRAEGATSYRVFTRGAGGGEPVAISETTELSAVITITEEGRYFVGVQSIREVDGEMLKSEIAWSDNPAYCAGSVAFGVVFFVAPDPPVNLRVE